MCFKSALIVCNFVLSGLYAMQSQNVYDTRNMNATRPNENPRSGLGFPFTGLHNSKP